MDGRRWAERRKRTAQYMVFLAVRSVVCLLQALSLPSAYRLMSAIMWLVYSLDRRHRAVAHENLRFAYGKSQSDRWIRRTVAETYQHFGQVLVETVFIPRKLRLANYRRYVTLEVAPEVSDLIIDRRAKIFVTGHFGNWEMAGLLMAVVGLTPATVARDLDNPYLHRFIERLRSWSGQKLLSKNGDFDRIHQTLTDDGTLVCVADQSAGRRGYFVDFFGRPASTTKGVALLAMEHDAPIIVATAMRDRRDFHYRLICHSPIWPSRYADRPQGALDLTAAYTSALESSIRLAPEQYFWLHRRWKETPGVKKKAA